MENTNIINHVIDNQKMIKSYIAGGIDKGRNIMLVYLYGKSPLKIPNWFGYKTTEYNAQMIKEEILSEFDNKPGAYGYGILLGKQPDGSHIVCIDIDIDSDCKNYVLKQFEEIFKRHNIYYHLEITKSGRYHIYVALDKVTEELKRITKITVDDECVKYKYGKAVPGEIELLGANHPHMATVYAGIINDEKPFFVEELYINSAEDFLKALKEFISINEEIGDIDKIEELEGTEESEETEENQYFDIDKIVDFFKLVRKYNYTDGWDIEKILSAICITQELDGYQIHRVFEEVYGEEYDENRTDYIIEHTREKDPKGLPTIASVIHHAEEFIKDNRLNEDEKKFLSDLITSLKKHSKLPDYLLDAENVYLYDSLEKKSKDKHYYHEWWFIERRIGRTKKVFFVEIETFYPKDIYKPHRRVSRFKIAGVKIDITRILQEGSTRVYEVIINDDENRIVKPPFYFNRLEDIATEITKQCADLIGRFDITLFQEYISIKLDEFANKHGGNPPVCVISKTTGWSEDFSMFFHYGTNDEKHELSKEHVLYKSNRAKLSDEQGIIEQHRLVLRLLTEGKLLSVLIAISVSSLFLKPFDLQPITCVLSGNAGVGKTTAALIATSLFYKSDNILINASTTKTGVELMLSALKSLPFVVDESSLASDSVDLLRYLVFSVSSGKGKTRGKKDLTTDTKDLSSNVFWTTEVSDLDAIKRTGAFRRVLNIIVEKWEQFTSVFDVKDFKPHKLYSGGGVFYIRFAESNLDYLRDRFLAETKDFGKIYGELAGIASTIYAGIIFLEEFYSVNIKKPRQLVFEALRQKVNDLLKDAMRMFVASRDDVLLAVQQYLYSNIHRFGQVDIEYTEDGGPRRKADGTPIYRVVYKPHTQALGEYDLFTKTFYITTDGFKTIARELEKEKSILEKALINAGVMTKGDNSRYSKVLGYNVRFYEIKFIELPSPEQSQGDLDVPF
jgi:hypothetical protein